MTDEKSTFEDVIESAEEALDSAEDAVERVEDVLESMTDNPETDNPETDNPETDNPETDNPETDNSETDNSETDNSEKSDVASEVLWKTEKPQTIGIPSRRMVTRSMISRERHFERNLSRGNIGANEDKKGKAGDKKTDNRVSHPTTDRKLKMSRRNFSQLKETSKTTTYGKGVPHVKQ